MTGDAERWKWGWHDATQGAHDTSPVQHRLGSLSVLQIGADPNARVFTKEEAVSVSFQVLYNSGFAKFKLERDK